MSKASTIYVSLQDFQCTTYIYICRHVCIQYDYKVLEQKIRQSAGLAKSFIKPVALFVFCNVVFMHVPSIIHFTFLGYSVPCLYINSKRGVNVIQFSSTCVRLKSWQRLNFTRTLEPICFPANNDQDCSSRDTCVGTRAHLAHGCIQFV